MKELEYLRSDLTKTLNGSIQIYLVIFVQKKTDYLRSLFMDLTKIPIIACMSENSVPIKLVNKCSWTSLTIAAALLGVCVTS